MIFCQLTLKTLEKENEWMFTFPIIHMKGLPNG